MSNTQTLTARELYEITAIAARLTRRQVLDQLQLVREDINKAGPGRHTRLKTLLYVYMAEAECRYELREKAKEAKS